MKPVAALLLTGGASRRMGTPKAELVVAGQRLADRNAGLLAGVAMPAIEVGPGYTSLERVDDGAGHRGPLAAVAAAVPLLPAGRAALVVAVDMPALTHDLLAAMAAHPSEHTVVPVDGAGHLQPLCARYSAEALVAAPDLVAGGATAMRALLDVSPWVAWHPDEWLAVAGPDVFADIDTPADLHRFVS